MRLSFRLLAHIAVLMLSAASVRAAEKPFPGTFRGGIGASLGIENLVLVDDGDIMHYPLGAAGLYVPMIISDCVKIEPEIGYYRYSASYGGGDYGSSNNRFRFGLGIFYASFLGKDTLVYLGIRGGILFNQRTYSSDYDPDSREREKVDFFVGPAVGAEHFLSDHFSLGAEVQFNYIHEGTWDDNDYDDRSVYYLSNNTQFFARFYFGATSPTPPADKAGPVEPPAVPAKKEPPVAPEESPAEIRHVQPPPEEPEKAPADAKQPDEKTQPPEKPAPEAPAAESNDQEGEKSPEAEHRDGEDVE